MIYTVRLEDSVGSSILLNSSDYLYTVHSGLTSGASYTVVVEARSIAGITVTSENISISEQHFCSATHIVRNEECICNATPTQVVVGEFHFRDSTTAPH